MMDRTQASGETRQQLKIISEELRDLETMNIYSSEEVKRIFKEQELFLMKVNGFSKRLLDFKDYIKYLRKMVTTINDKRKSLLIEPEDRLYANIRQVILRIFFRIKEIYEMGLLKFIDFNFSSSYFSFCNTTLNSVNQTTVERMINLYSGNPGIFWLVADWYVKKSDIDNAMKVLYTGQQYHRNNKYLYRKALKLKLTMCKNEPCLNTSVYVNEIDKIILDILEWVNSDSEFLMEILSLLEPHPFTRGSQHKIVEKLESKHLHSSTVWHTLAQRLYNGSVAVSSVQKTPEHEEHADADANFQLAVAKYQDGMKKVSEKEQPILITRYLDWLISASAGSKPRTKCLRNVFEQVSTGNDLPEPRFYITWADLVRNEYMQETMDVEQMDQTQIRPKTLDVELDIFEKATKAFPECLDLWRIYIRRGMDADNEALVEKIFNNAKSKVKEEALALWETYITYRRSEDSGVEEAFREALERPDIEMHFRANLVDYIYLEKGLKSARKEYQSLKDKKPYCKKLHAAMLKLERLQMTPDYNLIKAIHQTICAQFGRDYEGWIDYLHFYCGCEAFSSEDKLKNVPVIYEEAKAHMDVFMHGSFDEKFEELKIKYKNLDPNIFKSVKVSSA